MSATRFILDRDQELDNLAELERAKLGALALVDANRPKNTKSNYEPKVKEFKVCAAMKKRLA